MKNPLKSNVDQKEHSPQYCDFSHRLRLLLLSLCYFSLSYFSAAILSANDGTPYRYFLWIDSHQVFIDWMIVPYSCSIFYYCYCLLGTVYRDLLQLLLAKLTWAVFIACIFFVLFPGKFSTPLPENQQLFFTATYALLHQVDGPFNQAPSLHIIFCVIFFSSLASVVINKWCLWLLRIGLVCVGVSTWFTYQHHAFDIITGLAVGMAINFWAVKPVHYSASLYLMLSGGCFLVANYFLPLPVLFDEGLTAFTTVIIEVMDTSWGAILAAVIFIYLSLSFLAVYFVYHYNKPQWLGKRQAHFSFLAMFLFAPYLLLYRFAWHCNRGLLSYQRQVKLKNKAVPHNAKLPFIGANEHCQNITKVTPQLWVGPRLAFPELSCISSGSVFIDLSAECAEVQGITTNHYVSVAMLDLQSPQESQIIAATLVVKDQLDRVATEQVVYLHCAMGYSRCFLVALVYLVAFADFSVPQARAYLTSLNAHSKLPQYYISDVQVIKIASYCQQPFVSDSAKKNERHSL